MAQYQLRALRSNLKTFFGFHLHLAERCWENLQSARGPGRCKSGSAKHGVKYSMFANCIFPFNIFDLIHFRPLKVAMELIHICGVFVQLHSFRDTTA